MPLFDQWISQFGRSDNPAFQTFFPPDPGNAPRILYCGYQKCTPGHTHSGCRPHALFHGILEGRGVVRQGGKRFELGPGQGFLFFPGTAFSYRADNLQPWSYFWVAIGGRETMEWLSMSGMQELRCAIPFPAGSSEPSSFFRRWVENFNSCDSDVVSRLGLARIGAQETFLLLGHAAKHAAWSCDGAYRPGGHGDRLRQFLEENYSRPLSTTIIAQAMHIERSHCCTLFARSHGVGIMRWLSDYRLQRASELLLNTKLKLSDIAVSVGIEDPVRFSKNFKSKFGLSPGKWRSVYSKNIAGF